MHGLKTMAFLHDNQAAAAHQRATDPGNTQARAAEERLTEALNYVADVIESIAQEADSPQVESIRRARQPEWSVGRHGDEWWVLPVTAQARTTALAIIPPGARRYGMHYILDAKDPVHQAIVESILRD